MKIDVFARYLNLPLKQRKNHISKTLTVCRNKLVAVEMCVSFGFYEYMPENTENDSSCVQRSLALGECGFFVAFFAVYSCSFLYSSLIIFAFCSF